jgi:kynurenine formamidase
MLLLTFFEVINMDRLLEMFENKKVKLYDLSQPLNQDTPFWPLYPPFEVKYIKRKPEHGVNAQYIQTSNHIGTHLDAPRHFVTYGKTIDQIPLEWLVGPGVIVDVSDVGDLGIYTPEMVEERVDLHDGDILILHTGWHRYAWYQPTADEERYIHLHPGTTREWVDWIIKRKIHLWGVDAVSTDHPMNLPIGRFLPRVHEKVRALAEKKFGKERLKELFPPEDYQLTHNALFPHDVIHIENLGGEIEKLLNKRVVIGCFPWLFKGGEAAFARVVAFVEEE